MTHSVQRTEFITEPRLESSSSGVGSSLESRSLFLMFGPLRTTVARSQRLHQR